jgi:hypothetical protein
MNVTKHFFGESALFNKFSALFVILSGLSACGTKSNEPDSTEAAKPTDPAWGKIEAFLKSNGFTPDEIQKVLSARSKIMSSLTPVAGQKGDPQFLRCAKWTLAVGLKWGGGKCVSIKDGQKYNIEITGVGASAMGAAGIGVIFFVDHGVEQIYGGLGTGSTTATYKAVTKIVAQKALETTLKTLPVGVDWQAVGSLKHGPALYAGLQVGIGVDVSLSSLTIKPAR